MAAAVDISYTSVQRIWKAHGLKPHLVKTFKLSNDKRFVEKVRDVVGLYLDPPEKALVFSVDEKSQIQALDRTQPGLPMKKGQAGTMTHDYKRHGTTTLFDALNVATGQVIGQCMKRHRHQEWLRFLRAIERNTSKALSVHLIADNYATHKHDKVKAWLKRHPRFHMHFTPTSGSGSIKSSVSLAGSPRTAFAAVSSRASPNSKPPSSNTSITTMPTPNPSSGPLPPPLSSKKWRAGDKR